jgi:hypothetical protein
MSNYFGTNPFNLLHLNNGQIIGTKTNQLFENKSGNNEIVGDVKCPNEFPTISKKVNMM